MKNQCVVKGTKPNKNPWVDKKLDKEPSTEDSHERSVESDSSDQIRRTPPGFTKIPVDNPWVCAGEKNSNRKEELSEHINEALRMCLAYFRNDANFAAMCEEKLKMNSASHELPRLQIEFQATPKTSPQLSSMCDPTAQMHPIPTPRQLSNPNLNPMPCNLNPNHLGQTLLPQPSPVYGNQNIFHQPPATLRRDLPPQQQIPQHLQNFPPQPMPPMQVNGNLPQHNVMQNPIHVQNPQLQPQQMHQLAFHQIPQQMPMQQQTSVWPEKKVNGHFEPQGQMVQAPQMASQQVQNVAHPVPFQQICMNRPEMNQNGKAGEGKKSKLRGDAPSFTPHQNLDKPSSSPEAQNSYMSKEPRVPLYNTPQTPKGRVLINMNIETPMGRKILIVREDEDLVNVTQIFCQIHDMNQLAPSLHLNVQERLKRMYPQMEFPSEIRMRTKDV